MMSSRPEPPPASTDPGVGGPPSFLDRPFWEPTVKGLTALTFGGSLFIPAGILALLLSGFGVGKIMKRLGWEL